MVAYFRCSTSHDYPDTERIDEFYIELNIHDQESNYQKLFFKMVACFRCSTTHDFLDKVAKRIDTFYIELNIHNQESNYQPLFILKFVSLADPFLITWMAN